MTSRVDRAGIRHYFPHGGQSISDCARMVCMRAVTDNPAILWFNSIPLPLAPSETWGELIDRYDKTMKRVRDWTLQDIERLFFGGDL